MSADTLGVCIYYMAISWDACSDKAYTLAKMLGACIYYMAIGWPAGSEGAYMSADTLGAHIYYMAFCWHTCSGGAYIWNTYCKINIWAISTYFTTGCSRFPAFYYRSACTCSCGNTPHTSGNDTFVQNITVTTRPLYKNNAEQHIRRCQNGNTRICCIKFDMW